MLEPKKCGRGSLNTYKRVVTKAQIEEATLELAKKIVSYSSSVIGLGKKAFYKQMAQTDISQVC